jgi:hypothetical protein
VSTTYTQGPAAGTSRTSGIAAASVQTAKAYIGAAVDNATNLDALADIELVWSFGVAPTANTVLSIHLLWAQDGTNYEEGAGDGTTLTAPLPGTQVGQVNPPADTGTHRRLFQGLPLAPYKFKTLAYNQNTGQTATVTVNVFTRKDQTVG